MSAKAKAISTVALLLMMTITLGACTPSPKVQLPILREAPDFALTNQDGLEVGLSDFRDDKVVALNFIYTSCPDVCGIQNHQLRIVRDQLAERVKQDLVLISVSFDTEVDTPEVVKQYAIQQGFNVPGWQFLTGTEEQIRQVTDDYGIVYELVEADHEQEGSLGAILLNAGPQEHARSFNHTLLVVLIDGNGMVRKTYGGAFLPQTEMISDITSLLER